MNPFVTRALVIVSVSFNVIVILFVLFAVTRKTASLSFYNPDGDGARYTTGACFVGVPADEADLVLGTPEFSLRPGETAAIQYSLFLDRRQMNVALEPLYDHDIIVTEQTGYGLLIRARAPGETLLQTVTGKGINNIAKITVVPSYE